MKDNRIKQVLLAILLTNVIVLAYPFVHEEIPFLRDNFRTYDFFGRFFKSDESNKPVNKTDALIDSLTALAQDTSQIVEIDSAQQRQLDSLLAVQTYTGTHVLGAFFEALKHTKKEGKKTRIAYFGDSMIEGDLITQTLRDTLQKEYGGQGVGFVPITSIVNRFRNTVRHDFSDNWEYHNFVKDKKQKMSYGISGEYFHSKAGEEKPLTVEYRASSAFAGTSRFPMAKLFYGM